MTYYEIYDKGSRKNYTGFNLREICKEMWRDNKIHCDLYTEIEHAETNEQILNLFRNRPCDYGINVE